MASVDVKKTPLSAFSEDEFGRKIDRCAKDTLIKGGGGLFLGAVFSVIFFKRRSWPLLMGTGFGFGIAYKSCEQSLNASK